MDNQKNKDIKDINGMIITAEQLQKTANALENLWHERQNMSGKIGNDVFVSWIYQNYPEKLEEFIDSKLKDENFPVEKNNNGPVANMSNVDWKAKLSLNKNWIDIAEDMYDTGVLKLNDVKEKYNSFMINCRDYEYYKNNFKKLFNVKISLLQTVEEWKSTYFELEDALNELKKTYNVEVANTVLTENLYHIESLTGIIRNVLTEEYGWYNKDVDNIYKRYKNNFSDLTNFIKIKAPVIPSNKELNQILKEIINSNLSQSEKFDCLFKNGEQFWYDILYDYEVINGRLLENTQVIGITKEEFDINNSQYEEERKMEERYENGRL